MEDDPWISANNLKTPKIRMIIFGMKSLGGKSASQLHSGQKSLSLIRFARRLSKIPASSVCGDPISAFNRC
jgi:hypothetical protein